MCLYECVRDNYEMLVTVLVTLVTNILFRFTLAFGINIHKMPPTSKFSHQNPQVVNNFKSRIFRCHRKIRERFKVSKVKWYGKVIRLHWYLEAWLVMNDLSLFRWEAFIRRNVLWILHLKSREKFQEFHFYKNYINGT